MIPLEYNDDDCHTNKLINEIIAYDILSVKLSHSIYLETAEPIVKKFDQSMPMYPFTCNEWHYFALELRGGSKIGAQLRV